MTENQLQEYCKALHISTMFLVYEERYGNNLEVTNFLNDALSAEFQARKVNRQMRSLKQAGFPTVKRFEDLILDALPEDGRQSIPDL
jgi:DNA replication protein DnaC